MAFKTQLRLSQVTGSAVDLKSEFTQYAAKSAVAAMTGSDLQDVLGMIGAAVGRISGKDDGEIFNQDAGVFSHTSAKFGGAGDALEIIDNLGDVTLKTLVQDKDMIFNVNDGSSDTEVMRLDGDVSALKMASGKQIQFGDSGENISGDGTDLAVNSSNNLDIVANNKVTIDAQGTDSGDGVEITLGADSADTQFIVQNNSGNDALVVDGLLDVTVGRNLTVAGNLDVNGSTTTIDTVNLTVQDSIIALGVSGSGAYSATGDRGILFPRGAAGSATSALFFDGTRFNLAETLTGPTSGSFAAVESYSRLRLGRLEVGTGDDRIVLDTDLKIRAAADIELNPQGSNVKPASDSAIDLGVAGTAFRTLFVDDININGQGRIDLDTDGNTSIRSPSNDVISFEVSGSDLFSMASAGMKIVDDIGLTFGTNNDATFKYDEAGTDTLLYDGASLRIADDVKLEFGANGDASIEYDEDGTDQLRFVLPQDGMVLGGATPKLVIGDADAEDTMIVFDGNAQDYRIGLDDGNDTLEIGVGATHGTTVSMELSSNRDVDIVAHDGTNGLKLGGTIVSATATELSLLDGDGAVGSSITIADTDGFIIDDDGTTKKIPASDLKTYIASGATKNVTVVAAAVNADTDFDTGVANIEAAAENRIEVYVNGQLLAYGADASANRDFYPGTSSGRLKFEFALEVDDVVTAILR